MTGGKRRFGRGILRQQQGGVTLELALIVPVLMMLVFGIVDFGHAWYMKQEITTASREGARYATRYQSDTLGKHVTPPSLLPVSTWVTSNYSTLLPSDANLTVTPSGPGLTSGLPGDDLTVTVTARKNWFVVGALIPGLGNYLDLTGRTTMKVE
jgi:Flp pilus assembly protein TadG